MAALRLWLLVVLRLLLHHAGLFFGWFVDGGGSPFGILLSHPGRHFQRDPQSASATSFDSGPGPWASLR